MEKNAMITWIVVGVMILSGIGYNIVTTNNNISNSIIETAPGTGSSNTATSNSDLQGKPGGSSSELEMYIPEDKRVSLFAVGDNLIHDVIYNQAGQRADGEGYDFTFAYEPVASIIPKSGINFVNQETPLASALYPPSNYPLFNSPTEVGDELVDLGFNLINHANNHMLDKWEAGLIATIDYWKTKDVDVIGVYPSQSKKDSVVLDKNGIKIGFLAITDHINGLVPTEEEPGFILTTDRDEITKQIEALKPISDFIIVSAHWGDENTFTPSIAQQETAKFLADLGADMIIGHHSHTVQPIEWIKGADDKEVLVINSLGNFISAMANWKNMLGMAFKCELVKDGVTGKVAIEKPVAIPLVTHYEARYKNLQVYPLADYTIEMARRHGVTAGQSNMAPEKLIATFEEVISKEFR